MAHLKRIILIVICICVMQHILQVNAQAKKGRRRQKQIKFFPKTTIPPRNHKKIGLKESRDKDASIKGHFTKKDGAHCKWAAEERRVDGVFDLNITCEKATEPSLSCDYTAKPRLCPEYESNVKAFWKEISRSLKKHKKLCSDSKALLKARMCRKAPRDAHFALKTTINLDLAPVRKNKPCPNLTNRQKLGEEYCGTSWSSVCTFFLAMVETEDC